MTEGHAQPRGEPGFAQELPGIPGDSVTLTKAAYQALLNRIEDLEDEILSLTAVEPAADSVLPMTVARAVIDGETALRAWCKHRGLTLVELAATADVNVSFLNDLETGKRTGTLATLLKLATALGVGLSALTEIDDVAIEDVAPHAGATADSAVVGAKAAP